MRTMFEAFVQDVRLAARMLARSPLFATSAILTLALGIGANTAIFTLLDDLLFRPLPVREPDRIVQLVTHSDQTNTVFSFPALAAVQQRSKTLEGLFTWNATTLSLGWGVDARRIKGAVASGAIYRTLGLRAEAGRLFTPADDSAGAPAVAVLSDAFWNTAFRRDRRAIGRVITLDRHAFTIIGVTQPSFFGMFSGAAPDVTIPFHAGAALHPRWNMEHTTRIWWLSIFGRLRPAFNMAKAEAEMRAISPGVLKAIDPAVGQADEADFIKQTLGIRPGGRGDGWLAERYAKPLFVLIAVSVLVLLIACVNLANLMLARAAQREKEVSVRLALGAGRARLVRQFLTESVTLSCAGAAIGAAFAVWASTLASKFLPLSFDPRPDTHVLFYLAALAISTGILFGSAPAIRGTDLQANEALKLGRIGSSGARWSFGKALLAFQVALSVALLLGAFLFIGTLKNLRTQHTGFDGQNLMFITMNTERSGMNGQQMARFYDGLLADIRALPSVRSGSLVAVLPLSGAYVTEELDQEQWPNLSKPQRIIYVNRVGSDFFKTAGMHLLAGRSFDESDSAGQEKLAVLNAAAARTYFPTGNAIGRRLVVDSKSAFRIIGVVENAKYAALRDPAPRTMFLPATQAQNMSPTAMMAGTEWHLLVRADSASGIIGNAVRRFVRASGKDVVVEDALPFDQLLDSSLVTERILAVLAAFFAALAAVLVGIGLYGVLGYTVSRRTSEIGIRMALGAASRDVLWLVLRDAVTVAATGIILGAVIAIACGRFVSSLLFEARPNDPVTLIAAAVFTLALAAIAGYLPARRASRLDPMTALRWE